MLHESVLGAPAVVFLLPRQPALFQQRLEALLELQELWPRPTELESASTGRSPLLFEVEKPWAGTFFPVFSGLTLPPSPLCTGKTGISCNLKPNSCFVFTNRWRPIGCDHTEVQRLPNGFSNVHVYFLLAQSSVEGIIKFEVSQLLPPPLYF